MKLRSWCPCKPLLFATLTPWPGYMPHIIARPWAGSSTLQVPGYMEVVNLGDTSHRTDGTKVLTYLLLNILQKLQEIQPDQKIDSKVLLEPCLCTIRDEVERIIAELRLFHIESAIQCPFVDQWFKSYKQ